MLAASSNAIVLTTVRIVPHSYSRALNCVRRQLSNLPGGIEVSRVLIGTAGFSYKDWEGIVYPRDLKKRKLHPLEHLARFFDCCEINTSFYGPIRPEVGAQWCKLASAVNSNFQLPAKL